MDTEIKRVHFIGIGGVGMSGIAQVAHDQGLVVSGSDLRASRYTDQLADAGITVFIGHDPANLPPAEDAVVVISTAILDNNVELQAARAAGMSIWHRAQMLAYLGRDKTTLAVAGTHGKTTSSSMLASVLDGMGLDPSFLIGGMLSSYGTNAHHGAGAYYVVEADESDKSFTLLNPYGIMVTNVEADHLDHYVNLVEIHQQFETFMRQVDEDGFVVYCGDDSTLVEIAGRLSCRRFSYGLDTHCAVQVSDYEACGLGSRFMLRFSDGKCFSAQIKQNPGIHNAVNAAGVLAVVWALGLDRARAIAALADFSGVHRRFDLVGECGGITIVDDYAHHPTEIAATLKAAAALDFSHVYVLFQPHRYSRLPLFAETLHDEFSHAFDEADGLAFMDVYAAGEMPYPGVSGHTFLDVVLSNPSHPPTMYLPKRLEVVPRLADRLEPGDLLITMGAGDVTAIGPELLAELRVRANTPSASSRATPPEDPS